MRHGDDSFLCSISLLRIKIDFKMHNKAKELLTMLVKLSPLCVVIVIFLFDAILICIGYVLNVDKM